MSVKCLYDFSDKGTPAQNCTDPAWVEPWLENITKQTKSNHIPHIYTYIYVYILYIRLRYTCTLYVSCEHNVILLVIADSCQMKFAAHVVLAMCSCALQPFPPHSPLARYVQALTLDCYCEAAVPLYIYIYVHVYLFSNP